MDSRSWHILKRILCEGDSGGFPILCSSPLEYLQRLLAWVVSFIWNHIEEEPCRFVFYFDDIISLGLKTFFGVNFGEELHENIVIANLIVSLGNYTEAKCNKKVLYKKDLPRYSSPCSWT
jgi:hypothetical protein